MKKTYETITPDIRHAIADCIAYEYKKNNKLAEAVKVTPVAVGKWLKVGEQGSIETESYKRLLPLIEKYLKNPKPHYHTDPDCLKICDGLDDEGKKMLKKYKELSNDKQETINTLVELEWEKKYAGTSSGEVDMDHDKHATA